MQEIDHSNINIDYKTLETSLNYLLTRLYIEGKVNQNSKIEVSFEPKIKVTNAVNNEIKESVYTLKDI